MFTLAFPQLPCCWYALTSIFQNVLEKSPASAAGLVADVDYIVGLEPEFADVVALIEARERQRLHLLVYRSVTT